jgi:RNA polymerase sigma-70 factor (ECF subfamily)
VEHPCFNIPIETLSAEFCNHLQWGWRPSARSRQKKSAGFRFNASVSLNCCVDWTMSAAQAVFSGWMEITNSAVNEEARQHAEQQAIAALVSQYSGALYRVAYSVLRNSADAEDAVQETFMRVLRHRDTLDEVRDQRVWLVRIAWNVALDRKRRSKSRPETDDVTELARVLPAEGLSADERASAAQHHAHVLSCVEQLPAKERQVLMLSAFEELNSVEIAEVLGITESSVRSRLFRARNLIAGLLNHTRSER